MKQLTKTQSKTKVIALAMHSNAYSIDDIEQAGAWGYVPKTSVPQDLVTAVRAVALGSKYFDYEPGLDMQAI